MFSFPILDVAIGLILTYLLLSLICTAAKESLELWLKKRAKNLEAGIWNLLRSDNLVKRLYEHPLICVLFTGEYQSASSANVLARNLGRTNLPSYMPARSFALAIMDLLFHPERGWRPAPAQAPGGAAAAAAPAAAQVAALPPNPTQQQATPTLKALIEGIPNDADHAQIRSALLALADKTGNDANALQEAVEAWFNTAMEGVGGWYKRWTQAVILAIALLITVSVNADTLAIATTLSQDPLARQKMIEWAAATIKDAEAQKEKEATTDAKHKGVDAAKENVGAKKADDKSAKSKPPSPSDPAAKMRIELQKAEALGLPLGWDVSDRRTIPGKCDWGAWSKKIVGWLLTAFAISLGAPFWFDLLNKFMSVRAAMKPPEVSPSAQRTGQTPPTNPNPPATQ